MYDRPNAIKGRYVKIPNMLIFVAEPVNHEVIDLWRLFNIIYIMRIRIAEGEKQPPSVNQSYNQRPDLADAMSIPIVNSGT